MKLLRAFMLCFYVMFLCSGYSYACTDGDAEGCASDCNNQCGDNYVAVCARSECHCKCTTGQD